VKVGSVDTFTYTITDNDGTTSTSTLAITITAGAPPVAGGNSSESVNESALAPNGSGPHLVPDAATTNVSFTAGADDLHVTLDANALTTTLAGFPNLSWTVVNGGQEIQGFQNGVEVVQFDLSGTTTIAAGTAGTLTVTETLLAPIAGEGTATGNLGKVDVVATDAVNPQSVTDQVTATVVDDAPKANPDTGSVADGATLTVAAGSGRTRAGNSGGADPPGADTPTLGTGVAAGTGAGPVTGHVGTTLAGADGTLTLNGDGSFSYTCLLYTSPSPRDLSTSRMPSSA